jgi:L-alanine-DL-glutamate epimerase-like enolase superfamily enzyme
VYTDEGIYGLGEGGRGGRFDQVVDQWIGLDPMELKWPDLGGGFGSATYDIVGKALGLPAHKLMGAQYWEEVPVGYWSCPMEPAEFAAEAEAANSVSKPINSRLVPGILLRR